MAQELITVERAQVTYPDLRQILYENSEVTQSSASHRLKYRLKQIQRSLNHIVWSNSLVNKIDHLTTPPPWQIKLKNIIVGRKFGLRAKLVIVKVM